VTTRTLFIALLAASFATAACNAEKGADKGAAASGPVKPVAPPKNGDWTSVVSQTAEGGFLMGNPTASVKIVEFGSMTCPHCAEFEERGGKALIDSYVKKGLVSWEFRNFVRDPFDMTATLLARCGGEANFFGMTRTLFHDQRDWVAKLQAADQAKLQQLQDMPPAQRFSTIADLAGLKTFAAQRGVPRAKADQCLANEADANQLVQMNADAISGYSIPGTPSFLINGTLAAETATWETLEPKIKEALAS